MGEQRSITSATGGPPPGEAPEPSGAGAAAKQEGRERRVLAFGNIAIAAGLVAAPLIVGFGIAADRFAGHAPDSAVVQGGATGARSQVLEATPLRLKTI